MSEGAEGHNGLHVQVGGWLATVSYPRTFENTKVLSYESTSFVLYEYSTNESTFESSCTFVLSYFRTNKYLRIKVVIQLRCTFVPS